MGPFINVIGIFVAIFIAIYTYFKWTYQYWKRKGVPYFEPKIPFGNKPKNRNIVFSDYMKEFYQNAKANGWKYCGLYVMSSIKIVVLDLDLLKLIMTKDFKHFMDRGTYTNEHGEPLTANLGTVDGPKWKTLRPKLSPTFTSGKLKSMFQTVVNSGLKMESYISNISSDSVEIQAVLDRFGMDVIGSCAFGIECNTFKDTNSPFVTFTERYMYKTKWENRKITFARMFPTVFKVLGLKIVDAGVTNFFTKLVKDTIDYRKNNNIRRNDFMQMLIDLQEDDEATSKSENQLTLNEIISQSFLFFNAGFQTTSVTVTFTLFEMTQNPDIQEKLRKEIYDVLAKHNNEITYDSLSDMTYMDQVIKETLRVHNPVPINGRACGEDYRVPGTDLVIEKGTKITIPTIAIHYDEEYYPNPSKFDPERFNKENSKNRHPYAFIPFGEGPRICIGARFAMMEAKVALTSILRNYRVKLNERTNLPLKKVMTTGSLIRLEQKIWIDLERA